jgi:hypothetical protein
MKTQHDIKNLEIKLDALSISNDVKIGVPLSQKKYSPLLGYEYDVISYIIALVIPTCLKDTLMSLLKKQDLENVSHHEITSEMGYIRIVIYL